MFPPFYQAIDEGDAIKVSSMIEEAIKNGDLGIVNRPFGPINEYPLELASSLGYCEIAMLLLANGANVNSLAKYGGTALHSAVNKKSLEIVKLLLDNKADPNIKDEDGWTPLHNASARGLRNIMDLLISRGADPTAKTNYGKIPDDVFDNININAEIIMAAFGKGVHSYETMVKNIPSFPINQDELDVIIRNRDRSSNFIPDNEPHSDDIKMSIGDKYHSDGGIKASIEDNILLD